MRRTGFLDTRDVMLAAAGGVASAAIGHVLGRAVHLAVPVPMSGSIVAAVPRAVVLVVVLARVDRFGALTTAGLAESAAALGLGGMFPLSVIAPVISGLAADVAWALSAPVSVERLRLVLCAAALTGSRVLTALLFLMLVRAPLHRAPALAWGIVGVNVVLGVLAGFLAASIVNELRQAGVRR